MLADGVLTDCPLAVRRTGGEVRDVLVNASLYRDATGGVLGVVATAHDMTDRRRAEQERALRAVELERANTALEQANAALARSNATAGWTSRPRSSSGSPSTAASGCKL